MDMSKEAMKDSPSPVTINIDDLESDSIPLQTLHRAFGPSSLGILIVKDLPARYVELRARLLSYSSYLANLPESELKKLENEQAKYLTGWSCGKEKLKSQRPDTLKGSYYVNCDFYQTRQNNEKGSRENSNSNGLSALKQSLEDFPEYLSPTPWPDNSVLPSFRDTCEELCNLIIDVAALVARACDRFALENIHDYQAGYMERMVRSSYTTKARLLHYFPPSEDDEITGDDSWCTTHVDHGCLTGLTSAMYIDEGENAPQPNKPSTQVHEAKLPALPETSPPNTDMGLYIHSREDDVVKVSIPRDCLAFQTGEALEKITQGKFKAVPHFVRGGGNGKVARNTLAVFTQPNLWEIVDKERGLNFADFSKEVVGRY